MRRLGLVVTAALGLGVGGLVTFPAFGQASPSFHLQEHVLNSGGDPEQGAILASPSFRIRLDAIGDALTGPSLASSSWRMDAGFVSAYLPPGEVTGVLFDPNRVRLFWNPERSVGSYALYRGLAPAFLPAYGSCNQSGMSLEEAVDSNVPPTGAAFYYIVTARNRLREEGTKGVDSSGTRRANPNPCP